MQIILKQRHIEAALKQYIAAEGINLTGKNVTVEFTAGRKETGLSAEIDIADAEDQNTPVTPLGVVKNTPAVQITADAPVTASIATEPVADEPVAEGQAADMPAAGKAAVTSLFGSASA